jgi:hypothetical protein
MEIVWRSVESGGRRAESGGEGGVGILSVMALA